MKQETLKRIIKRIWRSIVWIDACLLRQPYSRCRYEKNFASKDRNMEIRGKLFSPYFESLCASFKIEIPTYKNQWTACWFCRWYMSIRLPWTSRFRILDGNLLKYSKDLKARANLALAREHINREVEASKYLAAIVKGQKDTAHINTDVKGASIDYSF